MRFFSFASLAFLRFRYEKAFGNSPIIETKEYGRFATNPKVTMKDFRGLNGWREVVPEYVKDYVFINAFM